VVGQFQSHSNKIYSTPFYVIHITVSRFYSPCNAKCSTVVYRHFYFQIKEKLTYKCNATNAAFSKSGLSTESTTLFWENSCDFQQNKIATVFQRIANIRKEKKAINSLILCFHYTYPCQVFLFQMCFTSYLNSMAMMYYYYYCYYTKTEVTLFGHYCQVK
jgi:hypothetical protein